MVIFRRFPELFVAAALLLLLALAFPLLAQEPARPVSDAAASPAKGQQETALPDPGGTAFTIRGIDVDLTRKSAQQARIDGWREAARRAWPQLWARMTGNPAADAPALAENAIENMVSAVEIEKERFSATRYLATLAIIFDRARAGARLPDTARVLQSRPLLLLPLLVDGGVRTIYEEDSPWQQAWARFGTDSSPIDYVRAKGTPGDNVLLTSWQARRDNRELWREILSRYGAENVLVAEARLDRSYPGGPITGTFLARHGPDSQILTRFRLRARAAGELDAMLDGAVRRIDAAYADALQGGELRADETLAAELEPIDAAAPELGTATAYVEANSITVNVVTPDASSWSAYESTLRSVPQVDSFSLVSLAVGGTSSLRINFSTDFDLLRFALDQHGLRLEPGEHGLRLRRRLATEAPLAVPLTLTVPAAEAPAPEPGNPTPKQDGETPG